MVAMIRVGKHGLKRTNVLEKAPMPLERRMSDQRFQSGNAPKNSTITSGMRCNLHFWLEG